MGKEGFTEYTTKILLLVLFTAFFEKSAEVTTANVVNIVYAGDASFPFLQGNNEMADSLFDIDPLALDIEWRRQPTLYHEHAMALAEAKKQHEFAKAKVEVTRADLANDIRADPEEYDLEKVTVDAVNGAIETDLGYQKVCREVIDARYLVDVCNAVVNTLDHRKKALENLVYLHGQQYYAEPREKQGGADVVDLSKERKKKKRKDKKKND